MYYLSPYTYVIEALLGQALGHQPIQCSPVELVTIEPPSGQSCAAYMGPYISSVGGYTTNPDATRACQYCSFSTTDAFLETSLNIFYDNHWRDLGIFAVFIVFNVSALLTMRMLGVMITGTDVETHKGRCNLSFHVYISDQEGNLTCSKLSLGVEPQSY